MQEEQSALQSPASMDTDGRAGKAAEHSLSMQCVKQGKAHEELPEEDAGQMHLAAQEQIAPALPEQATGQPPSSAVQERAEERLPEQAAGRTPSVKAKVLPEQSAWQTPSSATQEQPGEALLEHPTEQPPVAAVAEAQPVEDTASMHRPPARVTGVTSLSEQGVRAASSMAGEALPVQAIEQTPLTAVEAPSIEDTPSMHRQEQVTASIAPSEQAAGHVPALAARAQDTPSRPSAERGAASISGSEHGTGKAPAMTVEEVNALGQELCAKVRALLYEEGLRHAWAYIAVCLSLNPGLRKMSACKVSWAEAWKFLLEGLFRVQFLQKIIRERAKAGRSEANATLLVCLDCVSPCRLLRTFQGHRRRPRCCVLQLEQCATCSGGLASRLQC